MAKNTVEFSKHGWILITQRGYQTRQTFHELISLIFKEVNKLHARNKPIIILVDLSQDEGRDKDAEVEAVKVLKVPFDIMALFVPKAKDRLIINTMAKVNKSSHRVKVFKSLEEAEDWLENFSQKS